MKKTPLLVRVASFTGIALGAFALSALATDWEGPSVAAPGGNVPAPINVGVAGVPNTVQEKFNSLQIDGNLGVLGKILVKSMNVASGTPGVGKVLTDKTGNGDVAWSDAPGGGTAGVTQITKGLGIKITPTGGTGVVKVEKNISVTPHVIQCGTAGYCTVDLGVHDFCAFSQVANGYESNIGNSTAAIFKYNSTMWRASVSHHAGPANPFGAICLDFI